MKSLTRMLLAVLTLLLVNPALWPLDLAQGRIKLTLSEGIGRFAFSYLSDLKNNTYKPLLLAKDPRTSVLSIAIGNRVYRLGESSEFRESSGRTEKGARFEWKSSLLSVTEEFSFVSSAGSSQADGIRIDLILKNLSEKEVSVGVRYLFDTYLGEASYVHFRTDKIPEINRELTLTKDDAPLYWVSPLAGDSDQLGLMCMLSGEGASVPDRVVFANWKRLNDATWGYETSAARNFNLMPYSVNDSAVSHYFNPRALAKGDEWRIVTVMGKFNAAGFGVNPIAAAAAPAPKEPSEAPKPGQGSPASALTDLDSLNALISAIDQRISSGAAISDEELTRLAQSLAELRQRAAAYGNTGK